MPLEREKILVDNLLACLNLYQRSLVWALTASLAFFLLTLRLRDPSQPHVPLLSIEIHLATAWCLALALFLVFGGFALSALHRAEAILPQLNPPPELREAILLYPSLATNQNILVRVGAVLLCPMAIMTGIVMELRHGFAREERRWKPQPWETWGGYFLLALIIIGVYGALARQVWQPFGSR